MISDFFTYDGEFKKYHRKYPDQKWNYKAVSTKVDGKEVIFHTLNNKGKKSKGVEVYQGSNYGGSGRSYSRAYSLSKVPKKYKSTVANLQKEHKKIKWSKKKRVDIN